MADIKLSDQTERTPAAIKDKDRIEISITNDGGSTFIASQYVEVETLKGLNDLQDVLDNGAIATGVTTSFEVDTSQNIALVSTGDNIEITADGICNIIATNSTAKLQGLDIILKSTDGPVDIDAQGANQPINMATVDGDITITLPLTASSRTLKLETLESSCNIEINSFNDLLLAIGGSGNLTITGLQSFANDLDAGVGGLTIGQAYINNSTIDLVLGIKS